MWSINDVTFFINIHTNFLSVTPSLELQTDDPTMTFQLNKKQIKKLIFIQQRSVTFSGTPPLGKKE